MNLGRDKTVAEIISRLKSSDVKGVLQVEGTWGSFVPMLAAYISKQLDRPIIYICPHIDDADKAADDLISFKAENINTLPAWEGTEDLADATDEIRAERLRVTLEAVSSGKNFIIPTSIQALCQPIPKPEKLKKSCLELQVGENISPEAIVGWLVDNGFEGVERVDLPGQFARRGGIVDIFAPLVTEEPLKTSQDLTGDKPSSLIQGLDALRIEFFGDIIESIRQINLDTHLSTHKLESINIVSSVCGIGACEKEIFVNVLPADTIAILAEPTTTQEVAMLFRERSEDTERLYSWSDVYTGLERFTQLQVSRFAPGESGDFLKLNIKTVQRFQHRTASTWTGHKEALEQLLAEADRGKKVYLYCESPAEVKRLSEIITQSENKLPRNFRFVHGFINQGFYIESLETIIISHHELFGQFSLRRRQRPMRAGIAVDTLADLQPGDYVVHISYGIGKFLGIKTIKEKGAKSEYLTIGYADGVKIHVSVNNIHLVQKYIGTSPKRPKLSKVGSKKWQNQKEKVACSVRDLANELLELQAKRKALGGISYGHDTQWQSEFEESFPYQETADQTISAEQIKADMKESIAMDRLLCGDVGYGKTELAMRAAFKVVEKGKQVTVLVPTTVLSIQHGRTFTERFADFPVCIEVLNRFKTPKQAADIISRAKAGKVDILIGTHRLLSKDIGFRDLGLLIVDEEQRFGVEHKETLKQLRVNVDVLTMTATPIPRTLHMSLLGLRDISSLQTPPLDRRSIVTQVTTYNPHIIKQSIIRELNRQGQVFFLHNRVKTIEKKAWEIRKLTADLGAKIAVAHGQQAKSELEKAMIDFVIGETDVLVCTTIIESGLDIPNANTIFIDDADRFGLAQLHQLRGRVGRYKHRAYAYMLLPATRSIAPLAAKRLKAIEEYSHLGAGFRIALRDLEIRGAGNILGPEQSGHIQIVGYQMYCELLADAVRKLKNQPAERVPSAALDLGFTTYIPKSYIASDRSRMEVYRKIAVAKTQDELKHLENELTDIYGPIPDEVELMLEMAGFRLKAGSLGIKSIVASKQNLIFSFAEESKAEFLFAQRAGKVKVVDPKTVYLRLGPNYFEPPTLQSFLRKILNSAL